jgi:hypothetical protein
MLASYQPQSVYELRIAAQAMTFSFHALEALGQASTPSMPMTKILHLRGSAISLSRETHKAERRLDHFRKARQDGAPQPEPEATPPTPPKIENAIALVEAGYRLCERMNRHGPAQGCARRKKARPQTPRPIVNPRSTGPTPSARHVPETS